MKVTLDLKSQAIAGKPLALPTNIIKALAKNYAHERDLALRLFKLPVIPKGKRVVEYPATNPHKYAVEVHDKKQLDVCIGYYIYKDNNRWKVFEHVFNLDSRGRVQEHCDLKWDTSSYYVGMRIPEQDLPNLKFRMLFSRMAYILEHSPRALFDMPESNQENKEQD